MLVSAASNCAANEPPLQTMPYVPGAPEHSVLRNRLA
jgi:hypothetical protein